MSKWFTHPVHAVLIIAGARHEAFVQNKSAGPWFLGNNLWWHWQTNQQHDSSLSCRGLGRPIFGMIYYLRYLSLMALTVTVSHMEWWHHHMWKNSHTTFEKDSFFHNHQDGVAHTARSVSYRSRYKTKELNRTPLCSFACWLHRSVGLGIKVEIWTFMPIAVRIRKGICLPRTFNK